MKNNIINIYKVLSIMITNKQNMISYHYKKTNIDQQKKQEI